MSKHPLELKKTYKALTRLSRKLRSREASARKQATWWRLQQEFAAARMPEDDANQLHSQRRGPVRNEARAVNLARAFIRKDFYRTAEQKGQPHPKVFERTLELINEHQQSKVTRTKLERWFKGEWPVVEAEAETATAE